MPQAEPGSRRRWLVVCWLAGVVVAALLSRVYPLPGFLAEYTGDALYTSAAYLALALLFPAVRPVVLAALAWLFSVAVECSQLIAWQWLVEFRSDGLPALLLGQGFQWADFGAYAAGALIALALDRIAVWGRRPAGNKSARVAPEQPVGR